MTLTHASKEVSIGIWFYAARLWFNRPRLLVRYILENRGRRLHTWLMVEAISWWVSCQKVHSEFISITMLMTSVLMAYPLFYYTPSPLENSKTFDLFFLVMSIEVVFVGIPFVLFFLQSIFFLNKKNQQM